jgi:hypothetical protein
MWRLAPALLVASTLALTAAPARAGFTARWVDANPDLTLTVLYNNQPYQNVLVGRYLWDRTGGDPIDFVGSNGTRFWTYCTELTQEIRNPVAFNVVQVEQAPNPGILGGMGSVKADMLRQYFALHYSDSFTHAQAAAFQLGIWEIVFDNSGSLDVTSGNFQLSTSNTTVRDLANGYLTGITGSLSGLTASQMTIANQLVALSSPDDQDQLTLHRDHVRPVPAPPGPVLAATGLVPALALRRLRRRAVRV